MTFMKYNYLIQIIDDMLKLELKKFSEAIEVLADRETITKEAIRVAEVSRDMADSRICEMKSALRRLKGERGLELNNLRNANVNRLPLFKNRKGDIAHSISDGSDWKLSAWSNAVCGELGELANLIKKVERGDFSLEEKRGEIGDEIADVLIYLDILAFRAGVDLSEATIRKFNAVSDKVDCEIKL